MKVLLGVGVTVLVLGLLTVTVKCERPAVVNVGAVFTFNSITGRAAKTAMEIAVSDVNGDPTILNGTKLNLIMVDANSSAFMGAIGGTSFLLHVYVSLSLILGSEFNFLYYDNGCILLIVSRSFE